MAREHKPTSPLFARAREALGTRHDGGAPDVTPPEPETEASVSRRSAFRQSVTEAGGRIQQIVDAAEQAATEIEADARAEASRYMGDRVREADRLFEARAEMLKDLTAGILQQAEALRADAAALTARVARLVDELDTPGGGTPADAGGVARDEHRIAERQRRFAPSQAAGEEAPDGVVPEDALLRATHMAVAGNSREEIEIALRTEFGVSGPVTNKILDSD